MFLSQLIIRQVESHRCLSSWTTIRRHPEETTVEDAHSSVNLKLRQQSYRLKLSLAGHQNNLRCCLHIIFLFFAALNQSTSGLFRCRHGLSHPFGFPPSYVHTSQQHHLILFVADNAMTNRQKPISSSREKTETSHTRTSNARARSATLN